MSHKPEYRTRFISLNQPLLGRETKLKEVKPKTIYRAGQRPETSHINDTSIDEEPTFVDELVNGKVISKNTIQFKITPNIIDSTTIVSFIYFLFF